METITRNNLWQIASDFASIFENYENKAEQQSRPISNTFTRSDSKGLSLFYYGSCLLTLNPKAKSIRVFLNKKKTRVIQV